MTGFTFLSRLTQIAPPHTRFVFLGAGIRLGLPSHPASRRRSCLRLGVSTTSSSRGLSPPSDRPCRAYSRRRLAAPLARPQRRALPWRPARRTPGRILVGRPDQAAGLRHPVFANAAQRSASSTESPRGQSRSRARSRCPPDRDLDDSDTALNDGMREGCYRLRARGPRSRYRAADLTCPHKSAQTRRRHHALLQAKLAQRIGACEEWRIRYRRRTR